MDGSLPLPFADAILTTLSISPYTYSEEEIMEGMPQRGIPRSITSLRSTTNLETSPQVELDTPGWQLIRRVPKQRTRQI
jgi:hypothetical protein